jgi:hypothetical protein
MFKPVFFQKVVVFRLELAAVTPRFFHTLQNITINRLLYSHIYSSYEILAILRIWQYM